jgi:hypothetical protein
MALDYTTKYSQKIAERFRLASVTEAAAGKEYDFTGARAIRIYSMTPKELSDYGRGSTRYGTIGDVEYTTQEMLCTQAKSFAGHLEALDNSDIAIDASAGKFLRMELDERIIPAMDKWRLKKWVQEAATLQQMANAPTKNTIVGDIMQLKGAMGNNLVPDTNLTLFIPYTYYPMLKQADAIVGINAGSYNEKAIEKGVVGTFDGMRVVVIPSSYLPANVYFIIKAKNTTADPVKLAQYDVIPKAVGYSGAVVQGLAYYDSFVIGAKNVGIGVAGSSSAVLNAPSISKSTHTVSVSSVSGVAFYYTVDGSDPRCSTTRQLYSSSVTLTSGQVFRCVGTKDGCVGIEGSEDY